MEEMAVGFIAKLREKRTDREIPKWVQTTITVVAAAATGLGWIVAVVMVANWDEFHLLKTGSRILFGFFCASNLVLTGLCLAALREALWPPRSQQGGG